MEKTNLTDGFILPEAENALHQAVQSQRTEHILQSPEELIYMVDFSPDGRHLVTAGFSDLPWSQGARIWNLDSGEQVQWCIGGQSRYRLHAVLRPDVHPEMVTFDLASSTADFCERGAVRTCAECGHFMTRLGDLMPEHYRKAHPARGYWDRRYRRDEYAKFRFEDRPIGILSLEFVSEKPGEQLL